MKIPMYFDYYVKNEDSTKLNGFTLEETIKMYPWERRNFYEFLEINNVNENILFIDESYNGNFYYPIFWGYDYEVLKNIKIPNFVLKKINEGRAKLLIVNSYEGFSFFYMKQWIKESLLNPFGLDMSCLIFMTGNMHKDTYVKTVYYNFFEHLIVYYKNPVSLYHTAYESIFSKNNEREHKFICLQRRPKPHRVALYTEMYPYKEHGILTMGIGDAGTEINQNFYKIDPFSGLYEKSRQKYKKLKLSKTLPMLYDCDVSKVNPAFDRDIDKFYQSYLHVVSETFFENEPEMIFFSEKIYKPVVYFQPFVLFSHYNSLESWKNLGFETFGDIIDEQYDSIEDNDARFYSAVDSVTRFLKHDKKSMSKIMKKCFPIFTHNFFNLLSKVENTQQRVISELIINLYT